MNKNTNDLKLQKKLSPINVWSLALGSIIGWGAFVMPGNTFLIKAGPLGTALGLILAAFFMMIIGINYSYMINTYPFSGGEFTYAKETLGKIHGFICAWFLSLSYLSIVPLNATALSLLGRNLLGDKLKFGFHYTVAGYDVFGGEILLAFIALSVFAYITIKGIRFSGLFQTILVFCLIGGIILISIASLLNPEAKLSNLYPLFPPSENTNSFIAVIAIIAIAPWAFVGFDTIPQSAEEFNFSHSKTRLIMIASIFFSALIYIVLNTITASIVPTTYDNWFDYVTEAQHLDGLKSLPTFYAAYCLLGEIGLIILSVSVLAAIFSGILGFYMASSRLLYSLAREKVIPVCFSKLDKRNNTPITAIMFVYFISILAPFIGRTALGWIVDISSLGASIGFAYTSYATLRISSHKKHRVTIFTGIMGIIISIIFISILLIPIPIFNCSLSKEAYITLAIWLLLGILFYALSAKKNASINI